MRDVDEERLWVIHWVALVDRMLARRVVLDVEPRQAKLVRREEPGALLEPLVVGLAQHCVELETGHVLGRDFVEVLGPRKPAGRQADVAGRASLLDRDEQVVWDAREVVEVAPVDVPGENPEAPHD